MDGLFIQIAQLFASLSLLIILHELGHFLPAKLFKVKVERFYLFFNPWFSLVKKKVGETVYGIGWLPLGGYVKLAGMIDESMDKEQMQKDPEPHEFRAKPAWQRLIIMVGGVVVNLILGFTIYAMILFVWGERVLPNKNLKDGVWVVDQRLKEIGIQNGDKFVSINGIEIERFNNVLEYLPLAETVTLKRNEETIKVDFPVNYISELIEKKGGGFVLPRMPFVINQIPDSTINAESGLKANDKLLAFNGKPMTYYDEFSDEIKQHKNQTITLDVKRYNDIKSITLQVDSNAKIQVIPFFFEHKDFENQGIYQYERKTYGFFAAIPAGIEMGVHKLKWYIDQFKKILNPSTGAYKGIGGFGSFTKMFPEQWVWQSFWDRTAFISLVLAFMNILPIPALDGGHVMFLSYEMITGRKPNEKVLEYAQMVGMVILLGLLLYANGNDLIRSFFN